MKETRAGKVGVARERGGILVMSAIGLIGLLMVFGLAYDGFRLYREKVNQERLARSIGMVTLKAYSRAGCQFDRGNKNTDRIRFALTAASHVVDVENAAGMSISPSTLSGDGSYAPIEVVFEDPQGGRTQAKATIRLGSVSSPQDTTLDNLKPCVPAQEPWLNVSNSATDDWEAGVAFQAGLIPSDFNWKVYLSSNPDLVMGGIDTEIEAKRHFARYGINEGINLVSRTKYSLPFEEPNRFLAAEVTVEGLSSTQRAASFAKLFGVSVLGRSTSKVLVVEELGEVQLPVGAQALQVGEINTSVNPPAFNQPAGIDPNSVSYTMSMDLKIESVPRDWVNVFNTSILDCCTADTRRPALFISGQQQVTDYPQLQLHPSALMVHIVHGSSDENNRHILTRFGANPGQYFNLTWTVDGSTLRTFINGSSTPGGSAQGPFTWGQQVWRWNALQAQYPGRPGNGDGPVKVKNVYWWNRPLSGSEVASLPSARLYSSQNRVTLFKHCTFGSQAGGWEMGLTPGLYPNVQDFGIENDALSSLRIPSGTRVKLFEHANFQGDSRTLTADSGCLDGPLNFNDKTSSIIVESISPNESARAEASRRFHFVKLAR